MANWKNTIDLTPTFAQAQEGEIAVQVLAKLIADKLSKVPLDNEHEDLRDERDDLVEEFNLIAEDELADNCDADDCIRRLYDLGDTCLDDTWPTTKLIWIKTF